MTRSHRLDPIYVAWICLGALLLLSACALRFSAPLFAYDAAIEDIPIRTFVALYIAIGAVFVFSLPPLIRKTQSTQRAQVVTVILLCGALARLLQLGTPAMLEDDYNRYLWDGAVVIAGESPFAHAPLDIYEERAGSETLQTLADAAGDVLYRVNFPEFRTVYPPIAQAAFALSTRVAPFDLDGWRITLFFFELAELAFIAAILARLKRSQLWLALYWWNPLVIKEVANSAHMEPVVMVPVLAAAYLTLCKQTVVASVLLAIAAGVKVWPLVLSAALWRALLSTPRRFFIAVLSTIAIVALLFWPIYAASLNDSSGFVAFARSWTGSSAMIRLADAIVSLPAQFVELPALASRVLLGVSLIAAVGMITLRAASNPETLVKRMFLIAVAIYLLAPSQTPWYFLWIAPFLCIFPVRGLLLASVLLPVHYLYFYMVLHDLETLYRTGVVWLIWLPVWTLLLFDVLAARRVTSASSTATSARQERAA